MGAPGRLPPVRPRWASPEARPAGPPRPAQARAGRPPPKAPERPIRPGEGLYLIEGAFRTEGGLDKLVGAIIGQGAVRRVREGEARADRISRARREDRERR